MTLILGGVKSGKSSQAERWAISSGRQVVVVATARTEDAEMRDRVARHRAARPTAWQVIEEPIDLAGVLSQWGDSDSTAGQTSLDGVTETHDPRPVFVIVDCLTLWVTQLLALPEHEYSSRRADFLASLTRFRGELVLVSNESGQGVTPMGELSRRYLDEIGVLHQEIARQADRVVLMVAGLAQVLKAPAP